MWSQRFALNLAFLIPNLTEDGKPYAPWRFKEIVKECYTISKQINTSYTDLMDITPSERTELIKNISEDIRKQNETFEKQKENRNKK